jgi:hypothetical protein
LPGPIRRRIRIAALLATGLGTFAFAGAVAAQTLAGAAELQPAVAVGADQAPGPTGWPLPTVPEAQAEQALDAAVAALAGEPAAGDTSTALAELAVVLPSLEGAERRRGEALLARPTDGASDPYQDGYTAPFRAAASTHFCYFWVETGADAVPLSDANADTIPDYINALAAISEEVWTAEHTGIGWRTPPSDGTLGCDGGDGRPRVDVYAKNTLAQGAYGYAAIDPGQQSNRAFAFLVIDNDMAEVSQDYPNPVLAIQVTAAHEYNHVIQHGYDVLQDRWMFESTATWMEEIVYPAVNDYLQYIGPWARDVETPMTEFSDRSLKVYGSAVWNHFLSRRLGNAVVLNAWDASLQTNPQHLATKAYDRAIVGARGRRDFLSEYLRFAAATAEWRSTSVFPDSAAYRDVKRSGTIATRERFYDRFNLDHTTFRLANVPDRSGKAVKLELRGPRGVPLGLALVGRIDNGAGARVITVVRALPNGGNGTVNLARPARFARITAVLVNGEVDVRGFSARLGDWLYRGDNARIQAGTFKIR